MTDSGSYDSVTSEVLYVTPAMAKEWLDHNTVNRRLRPVKINQYARDMSANNWQLTGEAIIFDNAGQLTNGQHRCHAIIKSDRTVPMLIVRGVSPETQHVIDTNIGRTTADSLHLLGYKNTNILAAITRKVVKHLTNVEPSHTEIREWVEQFPELEDAAAIAVKYARACGGLEPSTVGLASWIIAETNGWTESEEFWRSAATLVGLREYDPILMMRRTFDEYRRLKKTLSLESKLSIMIRAYNDRVQGRPVRAFFRVMSANGGVVGIPEVVKKYAD